MNTIQRLFAVFMLLTACHSVVQAQQSNTEGLFLHIAATSTGFGSDLNLNNEDIRVFDGDQGVGLSLKAGYGFSPLFTLYLGYSISGMERNGTDIPFWNDDNNYALGVLELGSRFTFRDGDKKFRPYASVTLASVAAVFDDEPETSAKGGAISLGGGAQYFLSDVFALDAGLTLSPGNFSEIVFIDNDVDVDDDGGFFAARFSLGLTVYPFH